MANETTPTGVTVNDEELKQLREMVRQEERSKLATRLNQLEATETEHHNMKARFVQTDAELLQAKEEARVLRESVKTDKSLDVQKLIEEVRSTTVRGLQASTEQRMTELSQQLAAVQAENKRLAVTSFKARRISEEQAAGNKFIVELIGGDTEVEIEQSITRAKEVYSKHFPSAVHGQPSATAGTSTGTNGSATAASAAGGANGPRPVATPATGDAAAPAPVGGDGRGVADLIGDIREKGDRSAFAANRAALKKAVAAEFAGTGANVMTR